MNAITWRTPEQLPRRPRQLLVRHVSASGEASWVTPEAALAHLHKGSGTVVKCRLCGALYRFYAYMVGDQSVCPACRREADRNMGPAADRS